MTQVRFELDEYTLRVLDVIKGKYGLSNRSEALNKFAQEYGDEFVAPPISEKILQEIDERVNKHWKNHKNETMTLKELEKHLGF